MYYRRKLLLGLLEALDRTVSRTDLQKYLFLVCDLQSEPSYSFVPYRYGCFSFQAEADLRTLEKYGTLLPSRAGRSLLASGFMDQLDESDHAAVKQVVSSYGRIRGNKLLRELYLAYPYYAIRSEIVTDILNRREQRCVEAARPSGSPARLFTIGYEGRSIEQYLNVLIHQNIHVLCDLRRNPVSMKYGFSKNQLAKTTAALGIEYLHIPELGIASSKRRDLQTREDYEELFEEYEKTTLRDSKASLEKILALTARRRVALTCFESSHTDCHRGRVATVLQRRPRFRHRVVHL